jgi:hypothetical protein
MASGHVNRTNRPNTWLHRPTCGREESPCQPGAVHTWHFGDIATSQVDFRFRWKSGHAAEIADAVALITRWMVALCFELTDPPP